MSKRPNIQIDDLVRKMTEEEYAALLETGWVWNKEDDNDASEPA